MIRPVCFCIFAFMALLFFGGPSFADDVPVYLNPADDPNDALYEEFKAKRDARERHEIGRASCRERG